MPRATRGRFVIPTKEPNMTTTKPGLPWVHIDRTTLDTVRRSGLSVTSQGAVLRLLAGVQAHSTYERDGDRGPIRWNATTVPADAIAAEAGMSRGHYNRVRKDAVALGLLTVGPLEWTGPTSCAPRAVTVAQVDGARFLKMPRAVLKQTGATVMIWTAIAEARPAQDAPLVPIPTKTLARTVGVLPRTVRSAIVALKASGLIRTMTADEWIAQDYRTDADRQWVVPLAAQEDDTVPLWVLLSPEDAPQPTQNAPQPTPCRYPVLPVPPPATQVQRITGRSYLAQQRAEAAERVLAAVAS